MTNSIKSLVFSIIVTIGIVITGGCEIMEAAPTEFKFKYAGVGTFQVTDRPSAGQWYIKDETLAHALDSFLNVIKVKKNIVVTAKLDSLVFRISDSSNVDFSAYSDCYLVLKNVKPTAATFKDSIAIVFKDTIGKVNKLMPIAGKTDSTYDVTQVLKSPNLSCIAYYKTRRATPRATIFMQYSFELSYIEQPYN